MVLNNLEFTLPKCFEIHYFVQIVQSINFPARTVLTGRRFIGTELHSPYDVHFLKADGIWNAIVRLKR